MTAVPKPSYEKGNSAKRKGPKADYSASLFPKTTQDNKVKVDSAVPKPVYIKGNSRHRKEPAQDFTDSLVPKNRQFNQQESDENARLAVERDGGICQWCMLRLDKITAGSTPHHWNGRRRDWSVRGQVTLCILHHDVFHRALLDEQGNKIDKQAISDLMSEIYSNPKLDQKFK